jgi:hypothetical protein
MKRWLKRQWRLFWWIPSYHFPYGGKEEEISFLGMLEVAAIMAGVGFVVFVFLHWL